MALFTYSQYAAWAADAAQAYADRKGAESIRFSDQSVTFSSWDEVWQWLRWVLANTSGRSTTRLAMTRKGL